MAPAFDFRAGKQPNAEALIPVAVVGRPPVAIRGLAPPGGVVPAAAARSALAFTVYPHKDLPSGCLYGRKNIAKPFARSNHRHAWRGRKAPPVGIDSSRNGICVEVVFGPASRVEHDPGRRRILGRVRPARIDSTLLRFLP